MIVEEIRDELMVFSEGETLRRDDTLRHWLTIAERSHDRRTGAVAEVFEDAGEIWIWKVHHSSGQRSGESSSRKSARAAARKYVRSLDAKPEKQLRLFANQ